MWKILSVAYPFAPVGSDAVGGAEQVLNSLDNALTATGHESIVVAASGSHTSGRLIEVQPLTGVLDEHVRERATEVHRNVISRVLAEERIDLVHMHGIDFHQYLPSEKIPVLVTLHLPPAWYPQSIFSINRRLTWFNCVSLNQALTCPACDHLLPVIENGIDTGLFALPERKRRFALALGRICPEKGFHLALDAAQRTKTPMVLAGKVFEYRTHKEYFETQILPRLDSNRRFVGPVGIGRKRALLSRAKCLLVPSLAPETSSLVAMEALASGTPVIAFPSGALSEIVEHGRTGFLVRDVREMAEAIQACSRLDPLLCKGVARERFSLNRMVEKYFAVYSQLAHSETEPEEDKCRL